MALRILYLGNSFEDDAPTRMLFETALAAGRAGNQVRFAALSRGGVLEPEIAKELGSTFSFNVKSALDVRGLSRLRKFVAQFRPDILHTALTRPGIIGTISGATAGVPHIIITQHGVHEWNERGMLIGKLMPFVFKFAASLSNYVVTVSNENALRLQNFGVPSQKITVIHNGVNTRQFSPERRRERNKVLTVVFPWEFEPNIKLVGSIGNLRKIKRFDILIRAAAEVLADRRNDNVRFAIWGEGPERANLLNLISDLGIEKQFCLPGATADPATCLSACDLYVQTSRWESFGLAVAEAMASELPVICSGAGGMRETVLPPQTGIIIESGEVADYAEAISDLLVDPEVRAKMGKSARERIQQHFSLAAMTGKYLELYASIAHGHTTDVV